MKKIYTSILLTIFLLTNSCDSVRSALGGSKQNSSDEFLVEKKNPLVLPPDYNSLPEPNSSDESDLAEEDSDDVEKLVLSIEENLEDDGSVPIESSIEEFVLKKINEN